MNQPAESLYDLIKEISSSTIGVVSSPSTTLEIALDISKESENRRVLGQMVFVPLEEDGQNILSLGQIVEVETKNRWHEEPSFKGVIKHYGKLPHLSGEADNRLARISIQSSFVITSQKPAVYLLGMSPSTGIKVQIVNDELMDLLVECHGEAITCLGRVYGTDVHLPMWFKHFGKDERNPAWGAKDAYHIGVFGKTGSGKSVTSALMLLAYAKNKEHMNILILDPQGQFYNDRDLLPNNDGKLHEEAEKLGLEVAKYKLISDVSLPEDEEGVQIFGELLLNNGFIREAFGPFYTDDIIGRMKESVVSYIESCMNKSQNFRLSKSDPKKILLQMTKRFIRKDGGKFSKYIERVYQQPHRQQELFERIEQVYNELESERPGPYLKKWKQAFEMFSSQHRKITIPKICETITGEEPGNLIILDLSPSEGQIENENLQALFLHLIEKRIVETGGNLYAQGKNANCLIVLDEAHRFISRNSPDKRVKKLTEEMVGAVRTTRKYGIGHMFITQSLESLDDEIINQMRIFAFGHGLTIGSELRKIKEIINNEAAVNLYKSFIDPSNSGKFPFMFFGPVSPFSATGSPLFVEIYTEYQDYRIKNGITINTSNNGGV